MNGQTPAQRGLPYLLAGVAFILGGAGLFVYSLLHGILHITDDLAQFVAPGQTVLSLTKTGTYSLFLEQESVINGKIYSTTEAVSGLRCTAELQGTGQTIALRRAAGSVTYSVGGRSGRSVLEFDAERTGQYLLLCSYPAEEKGPEVVLAVGTGVGRKILSIIGSGFASMFGCGAIGAIFLIVAYRRWKTPAEAMPLG